MAWASSRTGAGFLPWGLRATCAVMVLACDCAAAALSERVAGKHHLTPLTTDLEGLGGPTSASASWPALLVLCPSSNLAGLSRVQWGVFQPRAECGPRAPGSRLCVLFWGDLGKHWPGGRFFSCSRRCSLLASQLSDLKEIDRELENQTGIACP